MLSHHDPTWTSEFAALEAVYTAALGDLVLQIEHVGSTVVADLIAKPILDIDIVISDYSVFPQVVRALQLLGYEHRGDQGIPQREVFEAADATVPFGEPRRRWMAHPLVCPLSSAELRRHVLFRDLLRGRGRSQTRVRAHEDQHRGTCWRR